MSVYPYHDFLEQRNRELEARIVERERALEGLDRIAQQLKADLDGVLRHKGLWKLECEEARQHANRLFDQHEKLKAQHNKDTAFLNKENVELITEVRQLKADLSAAQQANLNYNQALRLKHEDYTKLYDKHTNQACTIECLTDENKELQRMVWEYKETNNGFWKAQYDTLSSVHLSTLDKFQNLTSKHHELQEVQEALKAEVLQLTITNKDLKERNDNQFETIQSYQGTCKRAGKQYTELENMYKQLVEDSPNLNGVIRGLRQELHAVQTRQAELKQENKELEENLKLVCRDRDKAYQQYNVQCEQTKSINDSYQKLRIRVDNEDFKDWY